MKELQLKEEFSFIFWDKFKLDLNLFELLKIILFSLCLNLIGSITTFSLSILLIFY